METTVLGYPRIGGRRELKRAKAAHQVRGTLSR
jgi:hypothetical protein